MSKSASRLGVISGPTCPVARQRSQGPEQSKQKKQPTPGYAGAPGPESTQGRNDGRGRCAGRPHEGSGSRTGALHRELFCLYAKEGETLKDPTKPRRPAAGIPCSSNCVEQETNAHNPPHEPVSNRVRGEIEKNPCQNHGDDSNRCRARRPRRAQGKTCSQDSGNLQDVADSNRESRKNPALCGRGWIYRSRVQANLIGICAGQLYCAAGNRTGHFD